MVSIRDGFDVGSSRGSKYVYDNESGDDGDNDFSI